MPNFIALLESEIDNPNEWVYAQEADTRAMLETRTGSNGISRINKNSETYRKAPNARPRLIKGVVEGNIFVITFQRVNTQMLAASSFKRVKTSSAKKGTKKNHHRKPNKRNKK